MSNLHESLLNVGQNQSAEVAPDLRPKTPEEIAYYLGRRDQLIDLAGRMATLKLPADHPAWSNQSAHVDFPKSA